MERLTWSTEKRKVRDLLPYDINPRTITEERRQRLKELLEKFNLVEIPAVNADNTIIAGNQRVTVLALAGRADEEIDVRVPNRPLTESEVKEYALTSNTHQGEWDYNLLEREFSDFDLSEFNIEMPEVELNSLPEHKEAAFDNEKRWFLNIECESEANVMELYDELRARGLNIKIVN